MRYLFTILVSIAFLVGCSDRSAAPLVRMNVLDSIPVTPPALDKKYTLNSEDYRYLVDVTFDKGAVKYSSLPDGVTAATDGKSVHFASAVGGVEFRLSGRSDDGSFSVVSDSSVLVTLDAIALSSRSGAPVAISSRGVAYLKVTENSSNFLVDRLSAAGADTVKTAAAIMSAGDIVLCGSGKLAVNGKRRYALYSAGRLIVDGPMLSVENSVRDALSSDGGVAVVKGMLKINATKDAIKSKRGNVLFLGGSSQLTSVGQKGDGVQAANIYMYDGYVSVKTQGDASRGFNAKGSVYIIDGSLAVLTEGNVTFSPKKADYSSNSCVKCGKSMYMAGGYLNLENRATAGKGINCNGKMQMDGGLLLVRNYGEDVQHPTLPDAHSSAKGVKCDSVISINGGKLEILVFGKGTRCEGLESKNDIVVGGNADVYVYATDDALNSGGSIIVNGGRLYAYSADNDGIDSNNGIRINGGLVVANGSGSPEQGVDCDFDANFCITGGTLFSIGGMVGPAPNLPRNKQTTQHSVAWSGVELQRGKYINLSDASGNALLSYKLPRTLKSGGVVISMPELAGDAKYMLSMSDTVAGGSYEGNGFYHGATLTETAAVREFAFRSLVARVDADGNVESLTVDSTVYKPGMMPPPPFGAGNGAFPPPSGNGKFPPPPGGAAPGMMPPPGFDINNVPDSIKARFAPDGKFPFPPPFARGADEGYNDNNLPGGGWK